MKNLSKHAMVLPEMVFCTISGTFYYFTRVHVCCMPHAPRVLRFCDCSVERKYVVKLKRKGTGGLMTPVPAGVRHDGIFTSHI